MIEYLCISLNKLLRASCPSPFGPAELFKFVPDEFVRRNLASLGKLLVHCSITYVPVGGPERSSMMRCCGYASAGDSPIVCPLSSGLRSVHAIGGLDS